MTTQELMSELRKLSRAEQLRVIQMLATELAEAESGLNPDVQYEIWSHYDSAEAAATLTEVLEEHQKHRVDNVSVSKQGIFSADRFGIDQCTQKNLRIKHHLEYLAHV